MSHDHLPKPASTAEATSPLAADATRPGWRLGPARDGQHALDSAEFIETIQDDILSHYAQPRLERSQRRVVARDGRGALDPQTFAALVQQAALSYHAELHPGLAKPSVERALMRVRNSLANHGFRLDGKEA